MPTASECESRIQELDWDGLRTLWDAIARRDTYGWEEGRAFDYLVLRAFQLDRARIRWPYWVSIGGETMEQIDGAVHWRTLSCLVESKDFLEDPVNIEPIAKLRNYEMKSPA